MHVVDEDRSGLALSDRAQQLPQRKRAAEQAVAAARGPRYGLFASLTGGLQTLVDRLLERLREYAPEELGRFRLATDAYGGFSYTSNLSLFNFP